LLIIKVLVKLFQKLAVSKGRAFGRTPQSAKHSFGLSFLPSFFLWPFASKKKADKRKHKGFLFL
jgi:hypothetical protein